MISISPRGHYLQCGLLSQYIEFSHNLQNQFNKPIIRITMIKAFIFDFAGVLTIKDAYWDWLEENVENLKEKRHIFQKLSEDVDRAEISHDAFLTGFAEAA